jgi:hypothetical protein
MRATTIVLSALLLGAVACKSEASAAAADERASCASDNADCMDGCSGGVQ